MANKKIVQPVNTKKVEQIAKKVELVQRKANAEIKTIKKEAQKKIEQLRKEAKKRGTKQK